MCLNGIAEAVNNFLVIDDRRDQFGVRNVIAHGDFHVVPFLCMRSAMRFDAITPLASQRCDWNELSLDFQLAALDFWAESHLSAITFALGA